MITITYQDRIGAWCMHTVPNSEQAAAFMKNLRCEAIAKDDAGRIIGEVYRLRPSDKVDGRCKWGWTIEND